MISDVKALLTPLLLKNDADTNEIQIALRIAATPRVAAAAEEAESMRAENADRRRDRSDERTHITYRPVDGSQRAARNDPGEGMCGVSAERRA
jgi:hypothetical protein